MKQPPATPDPQNLPDPSLCDADGVVQAVGADLEHGLTSQDAIRRLERDGLNELRAAPVRPGWRRILAQFEDPLVYLLLAAVAIALLAWGIEGRIGWPVDVIVISLVVLLNGALGYLQEARAENAVAELTAVMRASAATAFSARASCR